VTDGNKINYVAHFGLHRLLRAANQQRSAR